jgi:TRAP-type C4-dicarboxylate transport system permease small subunit
MLARLQQFEQFLIKLESVFAAASLLLLLTLSLVAIFTRNLFDFGFPEIEIINRNLLVICGAFGAVLATPTLRHIKIDALSALLHKRTLAWLTIPLSLFAALTCAAMCYYAVLFCLDEWQYAPANERWALPFKLIYPFGFGLLGFHFLMLCARRADA